MNCTEHRIHNVFNSEQKRSLLAAGLMLSGGLVFANLFDSFWLEFLGFPSARICSMFFASDCVSTSEGYLITNKALPVHVTDVCSASNFFILLIVLISCSVIQSFSAKELTKAVWILPLAYAVTVFANSSRIIGGWVTGRWARMTLPENCWPGIHLGTGVVVFLTCLMMTYLFLNRRLLNGCQGPKTADR